MPRFLGYYGTMVPPGYLAQNGEDALVRQPVGTGPYRFVRWVKDDRVELEANADYWGGKPRIARVTFPFFALMVAACGLIYVLPEIVTWLPAQMKR